MIKENTMNYTLSAITEKHQPQIMDIFNHYIEHSFAAFIDTPLTGSQIAGFLAASAAYPALALSDASGNLAGFGLLRAYSPFTTLRHTAVISYFLHPEHTGKGLGKLILEQLCQEAAALNIRVLLAEISSRNPQSIAFHRKHGFTQCGALENAGCKFGTLFSILSFQKFIEA